VAFFVKGEIMDPLTLLVVVLLILIIAGMAGPIFGVRYPASAGPVPNPLYVLLVVVLVIILAVILLRVL
jgi:hypothetical protein